MSEAVLQSQSEGKFKLPSGKELKPLDVLRFCYDLSETDAQILEVLLKTGPKPADELGQMLKVSKGTINRSVNKLAKIGLIMRIKETGNKIGRPRYVYNTPSFDELKDRIAKEIEECANTIKAFTIKNLENRDMFLTQLQFEESTRESN
jgi:predicted transcriptional regulator